MSADERWVTIGPSKNVCGRPLRPVDELVAHDEVAGLDLELERSGGARRDDGLDAERAHRPDVRPVVDLVRRDRVAPAVARQERDAALADRSQEERVGRRAVRRVDLDLADVVEQRVEARTAEHADLRQVHHGRASCSASRPVERPVGTSAGRDDTSRDLAGHDRAAAASTGRGLG